MLDKAGKVCGVVKVATDITAAKLRAMEFESKMNAISRVQAVIEFTPKGEVITANENFLSVMGYTLDEIRGQPASTVRRSRLRQFARIQRVLAPG